MIKPTEIRRRGTVLDIVIPTTEKIRFMHISDVHWDSIYCERNVLTKHLDWAKENGAWVIIYGDWFDAMQGKFDPRRSMSELRPEYRVDNYYDVVVKDSVDFLTKYKDNILMMSDGNHEASILSHNQIDMIESLVLKLHDAGSLVNHGTYDGWLRISIRRSKTHYISYKIHYNHGYGGTEAPVTRGVIQTNRQAVYLPDANLVVNGHNHQGYIVEIARVRLASSDPYQDIALYIRTPGYKREYITGNSFAARKGQGPTPIGCVVSEHEYARDANADRVYTRAWPMSD